MSEYLDIIISKGKKVTAKYNGFSIHTDQDVSEGGDSSAPTPMTLFIASLGTCTGVVIKSFCDARKINTDGILLKQEIVRDESKFIKDINFKLSLPAHFPDKYRKALLRATKTCTVKKHLLSPPNINISY